VLPRVDNLRGRCEKVEDRLRGEKGGSDGSGEPADVIAPCTGIYCLWLDIVCIYVWSHFSGLCYSFTRAHGGGEGDYAAMGCGDKSRSSVLAPGISERSMRPGWYIFNWRGKCWGHDGGGGGVDNSDNNRPSCRPHGEPTLRQTPCVIAVSGDINWCFPQDF
jgi:hypothetical protein